MTERLVRYAVHLAVLDPARGSEIAKTRPVVIVSLDEMNRFLDTVVACPLTPKIHRRWRSRLQVICAGGRAEIAMDQIRTLSKERLGRKLDTLEPAAAAALRRLITEMYAGRNDYEIGAPMPISVRRVVTGHDAAGRAVVRRDESLAPAERNEADVRFFKLWASDRAPADLNTDADGALLPTGLASGGSVLRVVDMGPGMRSPMHRTQSLDYGIVLEGEVDLELDDGSITHLKAGDIVVQCGTIHAWVNNGRAWTRMAFVLTAANPVTAGGKLLPATHG